MAVAWPQPKNRKSMRRKFSSGCHELVYYRCSRCSDSLRMICSDGRRMEYRGDARPAVEEHSLMIMKHFCQSVSIRIGTAAKTRNQTAEPHYSNTRSRRVLFPFQRVGTGTGVKRSSYIDRLTYSTVQRTGSRG